MAQGFLAGPQHRLLLASLEIDEAVRCEPGLLQGGREEVGAGNAPQHLAFRPSGDACGEQGRGSAVHGAIAAAGHLMKGAEDQTAAGQALIDGLYPERQNPLSRSAIGLDLRDLGAERVENGTGRWWGGLREHAVLKVDGLSMFLFCSDVPKRVKRGARRTCAEPTAYDVW